MEIIEPKPPLLDPEPEPHLGFQHDKSIYTVQTCCGYRHSKEVSTYIAGFWVVALCFNFARCIYEYRISQSYKTITPFEILAIILMTIVVAAFFKGVKENNRNWIAPLIGLHVIMFIVYLLKIFFLLIIIVNPQHYFGLVNSSICLIVVLLALEVVNFYFFYVLQKYYRYLYDFQMYQKKTAKEFGTI